MNSEEILTKTKWGIDAGHSEIGFKIKHLMIANVSGTFREYDASIYTTGDDFMSAEIDFWLNPASIYTGDDKRDTHLKGSEFFDVEKFKEINFTGNTNEKIDNNGNYKLYGNLTIKGVTQKIILDIKFSGVVKDLWGNQKAAFSIHGKINRKDWGLTWNAALETGGVLVSDEVVINCEVELIQAKT